MFSGVKLQDEFADLGAELPHLAFVDDLLILAPGLQAALAPLHERLHRRLDLGLLEVMLPAGVDELRLAPNQLEQQFDLPLGRPPLKLLLHPSSV